MASRKLLGQFFSSHAVPPPEPTRRPTGSLAQYHSSSGRLVIAWNALTRLGGRERSFFIFSGFVGFCLYIIYGAHNMDEVYDRWCKNAIGLKTRGNKYKLFPVSNRQLNLYCLPKKRVLKLCGLVYVRRITFCNYREANAYTFC